MELNEKKEKKKLKQWVGGGSEGREERGEKKEKKTINKWVEKVKLAGGEGVVAIDVG